MIQPFMHNQSFTNYKVIRKTGGTPPPPPRNYGPGLGEGNCFYFQLAISSTDELYTWGFNGHGRLGHRTTEDELVPHKVIFFMPGGRTGGVKIAKCSFEGCFAVNSFGNLYCWGQNQINKLEAPYPIPLEDLYGWNVNDLSPGLV